MYFQLFKTFFMIGAFTIGGGVAMIPIIEKEVVENHGWLTNDEFMDVLVIAQTSPGVMAANMSIYIGYKLKGLRGAILCLIANIIPSFLVITLIASFFSIFKNNPYMVKIFQGMRPGVAAIIASATYTLAKKSKFRYKEILIAILVAVMVELLGVSPIAIILIGGIGYILYNMIKSKVWKKGE